MLIDNPGAKRACIYVFYDAKGECGRYVYEMLRGMREVCSRILMVVNGTITDECLAEAEKVCDDILIRENRGYDVTGYLKGLERLGDCGDYDEIVLMNSTLYGPFYPMKEMFGEMNGRDLDLWGILAHPEDRTTSIASSRYPYVPRHLQSYFLVLRKSLLTDERFKRYIRELPEIKDYDDARGKFEISFSPDMQSLGFKWDTYADTSAWDALGINAIMYVPYEVVTKLRVPVAKQKAFTFGTSEMIALTSQRRLLEWLDESSRYDVTLITEDLSRASDPRTVRCMLGMDFVLNAHDEDAPGEATVFFFREGAYPIINERVLSNVPEGTDVYVFGKDICGKDLYEEAMKAARDDPGRFKGKEYFAFLDLSKAPEIPRGSDGWAFCDMCADNVMASPGYAAGVAALFRERRYLRYLTGVPFTAGSHTVTVPGDTRMDSISFWATREMFFALAEGMSVAEALRKTKGISGTVMSGIYAGRYIASTSWFIERYGSKRKRYIAAKAAVKRLLPSRAVGWLIKILNK